MLHRLFLIGMLVFSLPSAVEAQQWARKMFKSTTHDYGSVARGSKAVFEFPLENIYVEDVHIAGVRSSCGCTTASVKSNTLKTWEKTAVIAEFNTKNFLGQRSATVTVTIDRPFLAEVQLQVQGFVRNDVVFNPGKIDFGSISQSQSADRTIEVSYAGRSDWKIVDVRSVSPYYEVSLDEQRRNGGRVKYEMHVRLKPGSPAGYLNDQLTLVTNDSHNQMLPIAIEGRVESMLTVSPASLFLGVLEPDQKVTKYLIVRASKPFQITSVRCDDGCFQISPSDESKKLHRIPVTFTAAKTSGKVVQTIRIETDLATGVQADCVATATVK